MAVGPFSVKYPVLFTSGGDTTSQAFHKHIQEIERIYGCLNALNADKLSASDLENSLGDVNTALTKHINSTNPHPNWKPDISVSWSNLTGIKPNLADFNGNLPMSRITGNLDASRISNLPSGITDSKLAGNGYAKFSNGLMLQWGGCVLNLGNVATDVSFPAAFLTNCWLVVGNIRASNNSIDAAVTINSWGQTGFQATSHGDAYYGSSVPYFYMAIGN